MNTGDNISAKHRSSVHLHKLNPATNVKSNSATHLTVQSTSLMSESQPGGPPECMCKRLRGEMWLSWHDCAGSPLAAALGCGGCEQIIPSSAERSKHQTHRGGSGLPQPGEIAARFQGGFGWRNWGSVAQISGLEKEQGYRRG